MTCQDVQKLLSAWRDGESAGSAGLSTEERRAVQRHLDECAACREALARLEHTASGVRELSVPSAPRSVTMRARALGRKRADQMSTERYEHERRLMMPPASRSALRHAAVMPAAPAASRAPAPAPAAPRQPLSQKRSSRKVGLLVGLGLIALLLLTAFALGLLF